MSTKFKRASYVEAGPFLEKLTGGPLTFGRMIESIRRSEEMSQVEFAKKLDISNSHLCDIEKERKTVNPARAVRFAEILGYPPEQFVRIALQDLVKREGLRFKVNVDVA